MFSSFFMFPKILVGIVILCSCLGLAYYLGQKEKGYTLSEKKAMYNHPGIIDSAGGIRFKYMLGINGFEWDFLDAENYIDPAKAALVKPFNGFRHYLDWSRIEPRENIYTYQPTINGGWGYDDIYTWCKENDVSVLVCLKTIPEWLQQTYPSDQRDAENSPLRYGSDKKLPASYIQFARLGFQMAARYGSNKQVDSSLVSVAPEPHWAPNRKKIGLGLIQYIECNNEPDRTWKGEKAHQSAEEYAANLSAFYDGHMGKLGPGAGVKNADPAIQVVMAGLAKADPDYIKKMIAWCKVNRGLKKNGQVNLCFDIINYHYYSFSEDDIFAAGNRGRAPELSSSPAIAAEMMRLSREYANNMDVWVTELGYDINQKSPLRTLPIKDKSALVTQADWILRSSLLYARCGIKRLFYYMLDDVDVNNATQFSSSGFTNGMGRRPVLDYFMQVNKLMGDYFYKETISYDPFVDVYTLNGKEMFVLTVPDEKGTEKLYELKTGNAKAVRLHMPQAGSDRMLTREEKVINGSIKIKVTETPVFVEKVP